ncbi:STAS domain-containing protein [Nonomuraea sp. FMUSA5-5]|uniref:STAS domain-containing protein n=1 Tax=Nonomuraea composti TaxID=2720023 RepID=A0ABX1BAW0_9ACTN|nr:STAS domain-containing protein [Nonomuraea sp. FMUSA5-5]NJP92899.1 STAS domain-containing protein [Nonomuraea sp. FMUSA5-5]
MTAETGAGHVSIRPVVDPHGLSISGELDRDAAPLLARALAWAVRSGTGDIHLDLGGVTFIDVAAVRLIARTAAELPTPRRLIADPLTRPASRLLHLLGWRLGQDRNLYVPLNGDDPPCLDLYGGRPITPHDPAR